VFSMSLLFLSISLIKFFSRLMVDLCRKGVLILIYLLLVLLLFAVGTPCQFVTKRGREVVGDVLCRGR